jgi:hypothetical protein
LTVQNKNINFVMANTSLSGQYNDYGYKNYGDGNARGFAQFLNGLTISQGQYLNTQGHPSSFDVLQSTIYNNYTYQITVEKEISKYRDVLLNLLHPTGMKILGRYSLRAKADFNYHGREAASNGKLLSNYTGNTQSSVTIVTDFVNKSNNIIKVNNLNSYNLQNFVTGNSHIEIKPVNGPNVHAEIISVDRVANTITIDSNTWLTFPNVAYVSSATTTKVLNILSLTGAYDIINNGNYSNTSYPLKDIVYAGDKILIGSNTSNSRTVSSVDYANGLIYLTSNASLSSANTLLSVNRTVSAQTDVRIMNIIGLQYNIIS